MLVSQVIVSPNPLPLNLWGAHGRQRNWCFELGEHVLLKAAKSLRAMRG